MCIFDFFSFYFCDKRKTCRLLQPISFLHLSGPLCVEIIVALLKVRRASIPDHVTPSHLFYIISHSMPVNHVSGLLLGCLAPTTTTFRMAQLSPPSASSCWSTTMSQSTPVVSTGRFWTPFSNATIKSSPFLPF